MGTFVFRAEVEESENGIWEAEIPALPGCAVWGYSREEALEAMQEVARAFVEIMLEDGERIPGDDAGRGAADGDAIISVVVTGAAAWCGMGVDIG